LRQTAHLGKSAKKRPTGLLQLPHKDTKKCSSQKVLAKAPVSVSVWQKHPTGLLQLPPKALLSVSLFYFLFSVARLFGQRYTLLSLFGYFHNFVLWKRNLKNPKPAKAGQNKRRLKPTQRTLG
jgi:hypothetical protein